MEKLKKFEDISEEDKMRKISKNHQSLLKDPNVKWKVTSFTAS